jgi:pre-mRNA-splicing factor CWC22
MESEGAPSDPARSAGNDDAFWVKHSRSGGTYVPPRRAALLQRDLPAVGTEAYQRLSWEALRKSLNGLINKVNTSNIKEILVELFGENLVRGRGLLVRAVMRAQAAALPFTGIYAAMIAVLNTKLPMVGELLLTRLIHQFRRAYRRNDKPQCLACTMFLAHLVNQRVAHEIIALQVLTLLLERPTDDSVEIGVGFMRECGAGLQELAPKPANAVFERFRVILHEGQIEKRVQYMVEVLFQLRKDRFAGHAAVLADLDLVEEEDQITHYVSLDDELDPQDALNIFRPDPDFVANEERYAQVREEILGAEPAQGEEGADGEEAEAEGEASAAPTPAVLDIKDRTGTNLVNLRKTIYLTIMSSVDFEECGHKLLKLSIPEGLEIELCNMVVECCSQEKTYLKYYGLLAERFCTLDPVWREGYELCFQEVYRTVHRLETNRIRNISRLFGHLLYADALSWAVLGCVVLTEEDTTSASRILLKFLLQELVELFGMPELKARLEDPRMRAEGYFAGLFPADDVRALRFAINYFTAIGLGALTEGMRAHLEALMLADDSQANECYQEDPPVQTQFLPPPPSPADSYASTVRARSRSRSPQPQPQRYRSRSPGRRHRSRSRSRDDRRDTRDEPYHDRRRERSPERRGRPGRSPSPRHHRHHRRQDHPSPRRS